MKFKFRLETLMRQRKIERDLSQREYAEAQNLVNRQLTLIKSMYTSIDEARQKSEEILRVGGLCAIRLQLVEQYIDGQKIKTQEARQKARGLMQQAEEKHEILVEKMQNYKAIEKLKEKKKDEFKKIKVKKELKEIDDIVTMRFVKEG